MTRTSKWGLFFIFLFGICITLSAYAAVYPGSKLGNWFFTFVFCSGYCLHSSLAMYDTNRRNLRDAELSRICNALSAKTYGDPNERE